MTRITRSEFEDRIKELIGHTLLRVRYFEIQYEGGQPSWNTNSQFDSLDFGLELEMQEGQIFGLIWGNEFWPYGISIKPWSLKQEVKEPRIWDVSQNSQWTNLIGKKISNSRIYWARVKTEGQFIDYPQDLEITFSSGHAVYISAFEVWPNGSVMGMMDNITVFFAEDTTKEFKIGPYMGRQS